MDFLQEAVSLTDAVLSTRQHLHRHPELSMHEEQTREYIEKQLTMLGIEHSRFQDCCGVMGIIRNGEGKCIAVRADMDAMPVTEETGLPFASENPGVMHACGHDVHMALALTTAKWLAENKDKWHGTVKLLFEPAEETYGGGQWMVAQGCMENPTVDCVVGQHVNPRYPSGTFYAKGGYVSGSSDELCVYVRGHSCHGAYPEGVSFSILIMNAFTPLINRFTQPKVFGYRKK